MRFMMGVLGVAAMVPAMASAQTAAPAAKAVQAPASAPAAAGKHYSIDDTEIGTLLDDPAARAVLDKHFPGMTTNEQIDMARGMTLKGIQQYNPDEITDAKLAAAEADFKKMPAK